MDRTHLEKHLLFEHLAQCIFLKKKLFFFACFFLFCFCFQTAQSQLRENYHKINVHFCDAYQLFPNILCLGIIINWFDKDDLMKHLALQIVSIYMNEQVDHKYQLNSHIFKEHYVLKTMIKKM